MDFTIHVGINANDKLQKLRELAHYIHANRVNESVEAIAMAETFLTLDQLLTERQEIPRDWVPF